MGFEVNPYDRCVANRIVNENQQTICWYVDDNKLSHKDPAVNDEVLDKLTERFGGLDISRGNEHNFLGIDFKILEDFFKIICTNKLQNKYIGASKDKLKRIFWIPSC